MKPNHGLWLATLLSLAGAAAYSAAQPKPQPSAAKPAPAMCEHDCPMHGAFELADFKVEDTKQGAAIQLIAKRPEDVAKVRELAKELASHAHEDGCSMMHEHDEHMHGHHGDGMHEHNAPASKP